MRKLSFGNIVFLLVVLVGAFLVMTNLKTCGTQDECVAQRVEDKRGIVKSYETKIAELNGEIAGYQKLIDGVNAEINEEKKGFSAKYILDQILNDPEGGKRQAPKEILGLLGKGPKITLIPQAYADSSQLPKDQVNQKTLRYQAVLTSVGSPYANVDIESSCIKANVTQYQCDILVAIAQSESQSGKDFRSISKTKEEAIVLGQNYYHNPVGIKDLRVETERERNHPDENGMYLRRFSSWNEFWDFYPAHMKTAYFDRGGYTPALISKCYVRGDCYIVKPQWVYRVESFMNKI